MMEIVGIVAGVIIALMALIYQIKGHKKKPKKFNGHIGGPSDESRAFTRFIFKNVGRVVDLDLCLYDRPIFQEDLKGQFTFSYLLNRDNEMEGGVTVSIDIREDDDFFFDNRPSSKRLKGYFKIVGTNGPVEGCLNVLMKPVSIESSW